MLYRCAFIIVVFCLSVQAQDEEPEGIGEEGGNAQEVYNKTYIEHQTALEKSIFTGYKNNRRPVRNISMPTEVQIHFHIIHASINQNEQTMTLHGHLYMTWYDEFLGWDASDFNGIRITRCRKWQVWQPKIKVANSVAGVYSAFEIASQAHVLIQTHGKKFAKVEMYPTFSIKVGCNLDYSAFPYDVNRCALSIFATQRMSEVQLKVYYGMPPTLSLGWGDQADKRVISDFEIINVTNSLSYYKHGNTTDLEPITANEMAISWSILHTTVTFRRHSVLFTVGMLLPCLVSAIFNILPFFLPSLTYAIYSFVSNVVLQAVFLQELINKLPLVANTVPKSVSFYSITMLLNVTSLALHLVFHYLTDRHDPPPKLILSLLSLLKFTPFTPKNSTEQDNNIAWSSRMTSFRTTLGLLVALIYLVLVFILLVF